MSDHMTKIQGAPDSSSAVPGMAFFANTGPFDTTCGDCKFRGYKRQSRTASYDAKTNTEYFKMYRVQKCEMFRRMTGRHGTDIDPENKSCKYFERKEEKK